MTKKALLILSVGLVVLMTISTLYAHYAESVIKTDMGDSLQVVKARKFLMEATKDNMIALNQKLKAGNFKDGAIHGESIAAFAVVLPPLFKETHKGVYPIKDSRSFFKGAPPVQFEKAAEKMRAAAMTVKKAFEGMNQDEIKGAVQSLGAACGGCHSAFRGKE